MCTSLLYFDASHRAYLGRTLELSVELPYQVTYVPPGAGFSSAPEGFAPVSWTARHAYLAITMPNFIPQPGVAPKPGDLNVVEGVNAAGLTFSVQSYPAAGGADPVADASLAMLSAADLGAWTLAQFSTVDEVKAALEAQSVVVPAVPILGGQKMPFHYSVHDAKGGSIVIEFHFGVRAVYDNPVGVLTNAPQFPWHLTNLNNYTFLSNVDRSSTTFGSYEAQQPDSGISKAGLPSSDTAVARFVRAAFFAKYGEKQTDPDKAVQLLAHIMNNFDRPRGVSISNPDDGENSLHIQGHEVGGNPTEFTSWTSLTDLERKRFYVRGSDGLSYADFDLMKLAATMHEFRTVPMASVLPMPQDMTAALA